MLSTNSLTPPVLFSFTPQSGPVGSTVRIFPSEEFFQLSAVQFNGINAVFSINFDTGGYNATVPQGATTGKIKLVYFGGSSTSSSNFTVTAAPVINVPTISNFTPTTGTAGTVVQINGQNLGTINQAKLNGVNAFVRFVSTTRVDIEVPQGATTGRIVLTGPDGSATSPTDFLVPVQSGGPTVSSFSPATGKPGDPISIFGTGFTNVLQVFFNGTPAGFSPINAGQINANVPSGATTGRISVQTSAGTGTSLQDFQIQTTVGIPVITSFTPSSGKAGDVIMVSGQSLSAITAASINFTPASFSLISNIALALTVPNGATTGRIRLTNSAGQGISATDFLVTTPAQKPVISSFSPTSGKAGDQVTLLGQYFGGTTQVMFGSKVASFNPQNDTLITAIVPQGVVTGPISVTNAAGTTTSVQAFTVVDSNALTIASFSPSSGRAGDTLSIFGTGFSTVNQVLLGSTSLPFTIVSANQIQAMIPSGATTGLVTVKTPIATAISATAFTVITVQQAPPVIYGFTPSSGPAGTRVAVNGDNFAGFTMLRLGTTVVQPVSVLPDRIDFDVPQGAITGRISITTGGGTITTTTEFIVTVVTSNLPQINSFSPAMGPSGTVVTINGVNLSPVTALKLGSISVTPTLVQADKLQFTVPQGAATGTLQVTTPNGMASSATAFVVSIAPSTGSPSFFVDPVQTTDDDDIVPLVLNEDRPDFDGVDSIGLLTLISGQKKGFDLFAKRFDMMPDKVQVQVLDPLPEGMRIIVPATPVNANTKFRVKVETDPILKEKDLYIVRIGGSSVMYANTVYQPFTLNVQVFPPIEFRIPNEVMVSPGKSTKINVVVVRRTYAFEVQFTVTTPNAGIKVTKSSLLKTEVSVGERGGLKDTYEVTFAADLNAAGGSVDVSYNVSAPTNYRIKIPRQMLTVTANPKIILGEPTDQMVIPGGRLNYQYTIVVGADPGPYTLKVKQGPNPTSSDIRLPQPVTIDPSKSLQGQIKIDALEKAKQGRYNFLATLESQMGVLYDEKPFIVEVTNELVEFYPRKNPASVFENENYNLIVDFGRLQGFTGPFLFDVNSAAPNVTVTRVGDQEVMATERMRNLNFTSGGNAFNVTSGVSLVARSVAEPALMISKLRTLNLLVRRNDRIFEFMSDRIFIQPNEIGDTVLRFLPEINSATVQPLGEGETIVLTLNVTTQAGRPVSGFNIQEGGITSNGSLSVSLNNSKRQTQIKVNAIAGFNTFAIYRISGTWRLLSRTTVTGIVPVCEVYYGVSAPVAPTREPILNPVLQPRIFPRVGGDLGDGVVG